MTDRHLEDHDPLAGRDPFPRHQIDVLPLHDARRELLEEIVSEPGQSTSSRRRAAAGVGIAAALALVAGGAWAVTRGDDDTAEDPVVASSSTPDSPDPTVADDATAPTRATDPPETADPGRNGKGRRVLADEDCRDVSVRDLRRLSREGSLDDALTRLERRPRSRGDQLVYLVTRKGEQRLLISADCRVLRLRDAPRDR